MVCGLLLFGITGNEWNWNADGGLKGQNRGKMNDIQGSEVRFENDLVRFTENQGTYFDELPVCAVSFYPAQGFPKMLRRQIL